MRLFDNDGNWTTRARRINESFSKEVMKFLKRRSLRDIDTRDLEALLTREMAFTFTMHRLRKRAKKVE